MFTVIQQNDIGWDAAQRYLCRVIEHSNNSSAASVPLPLHKAALKVPSCTVNDVVMVGRFYQDQLRILHAMCSYSIFFFVYIIRDETFSTSTIFKYIWFGQLWPAESVKRDRVFGGRGFQPYLKLHGIYFVQLHPTAIIRIHWNPSMD